MKKYCTKCGKPFEAVGREVICPACKQTAAEAAEDKFRAIVDDLAGECDTCYGEMEGSQYDYYVTDGDHDVEIGRVVSGPDYYCQVSVIER